MAAGDRPARFVVGAVAAVAALLVSAIAPEHAAAQWLERVSPSSGMSVATDALAPASGLSLRLGTCTVLVGDSVRVSWTATSSTWADGYEVLRSTSSGGTYSVIARVSGRSTTTYDDTPVAFSTTYYYRVRATKAAWTSTPTATASITTRTTLCV